MAMGHWLLRASLLANVAFVISVLSIYDPTVLQTSASTVFFWEHDPTLALWSFYGLVIGLATLIGMLAARSIGNSAVQTYK
jgi:uncharacterized protein with PQ loop repeat